MKIKLQLPPAIEALLDVVAPDQRQDLRLTVDTVDKASWRFTFRWAGTEDGLPVAVLDSIEEVGAQPRPRILIQEMPRKAIEGE
jgi:hypothetical protein